MILFCKVSAAQIMKNNKWWSQVIVLLISFLALSRSDASEGDIHIPDLTQVKFDGLGGMSGANLMYVGLVICLVGAIFGLVQYKQTKGLPVHKSMADVSNTIWET